MRATIWREYRFASAHWLPLVPPGHKCGRTHGHSYRARVEVTGDMGPAGWVRDFADVDEAVAPLRAQLDHHLLNEVPGLENPTSENLCLWLWERLAPRLTGLSAVTVCEEEHSGCTYRGGAA